MLNPRTQRAIRIRKRRQLISSIRENGTEILLTLLIGALLGALLVYAMDTDPQAFGGR
jgi:hypothetical protein